MIRCFILAFLFSFAHGSLWAHPVQSLDQWMGDDTSVLGTDGVSFDSLLMVNEVKGIYDRSEQEQSLEAGESYRLTDLSLFLNFGLDHLWDGALGVNLRKVDSTFEDSALDRHGLESVLLAFKWNAYLGKKGAVTLRPIIGHALHDSDKDAIGEKLSLGDGGDFLLLGALSEYRFTSTFSSFHSLALHHFTKNIGPEILWKVGFKKDMADWFNVRRRAYFLKGTFGGLITLSMDDKNRSEEGKAPLIQDPGKYFDGLNRRGRFYRVDLGFPLGQRWGFNLQYGALLAGKELPGDQTLGIQLSFVDKLNQGLEWDTDEGAATVTNFRDYYQQALVSQVFARNEKVLIDKGQIESVQVGSTVDFFQLNEGDRTFMARGVVVYVGLKSSEVKIQSWALKEQDRYLKKGQLALIFDL